MARASSSASRGEIDFLKIQHLSQEEAASEAEDLYRRWEDLSQAQRRGIVQAAVNRVTVGKDEIEITLSYLPRTPEPPPPLSLKIEHPEVRLQGVPQQGAAGGP